MKKTWQPEELVEYWTLLPLELALLNQKNDENRLGFAIFTPSSHYTKLDELTLKSRPI